MLTLSPSPLANIQVETDHPILFIGNLYDNVTPLESAHNNSAHFPGSVVLQQNTLGVSPTTFHPPFFSLREHVVDNPDTALQHGGAIGLHGAICARVL